MDAYGLSTADCFPVDDLLDLSNDQLFTPTDSATFHYYSSDKNYAAATGGGHSNIAPNAYQHYYSADFTHDLCLPSSDLAELEWLSNFVDDSSVTEFHSNYFAVNANLLLPDVSSSHVRSRSKRSKAAAPTTFNQTWTNSSPEPTAPSTVAKSKRNESSSSSSERTGDGHLASESSARRCTHCASEKTPQWRAGPLGPKTLCNACGVRYKSGRLVPEYRPAASPTFVLTQHSNSHRKVMELRRQKEEEEEEEEICRQQQQQHRHGHGCLDFEVC